MMAVFAEGMRLGMSYTGRMPEGDFGALASQIIKQYEEEKAKTGDSRTGTKRKRAGDDVGNDNSI
jgi:hypothetical protein